MKDIIKHLHNSDINSISLQKMFEYKNMCKGFFFPLELYKQIEKKKNSLENISFETLQNILKFH